MPKSVGRGKKKIEINVNMEVYRKISPSVSKRFVLMD